MSKLNPFKLFANCIIVKGAARSTICDIERGKILLIPNALHDLLEAHDGKTLHEVKAAYKDEYDAIIDEYFSFLEKEDVIFYTSMPDLFPGIDRNWHYPAAIQNCILDLQPQGNTNYREVIRSLDILDCSYLQIRSYFKLGQEVYDGLMRLIEDTTITSVSFIIPFVDGVSVQSLSRFCDRYKRIVSLTVYGSPEAQSYQSQELITGIEFIQKIITNEACCGVVSDNYFIADYTVLTESLHHNTCLNRKISIDAEGNIKNCPSMKQSFGNICDTTLQEALDKPDFKKYWNLTKDQVGICKDCEFRHVCTDCRAYLENPDDIYSKPLKCGYDPYTCSWEDWSTHPMKQEAIRYYFGPA